MAVIERAYRTFPPFPPFFLPLSLFLSFSPPLDPIERPLYYHQPLNTRPIKPRFTRNFVRSRSSFIIVIIIVIIIIIVVVVIIISVDLSTLC